jgi:hypothetical protein
MDREFLIRGPGVQTTGSVSVMVTETGWTWKVHVGRARKNPISGRWVKVWEWSRTGRAKERKTALANARRALTAYWEKVAALTLPAKDGAPAD